MPLIARDAANAPDIDGRVVLKNAVAEGEFVDVAVTGTQVYDLIARPVVR